MFLIAINEIEGVAVLIPLDNDPGFNGITVFSQYTFIAKVFKDLGSVEEFVKNKYPGYSISKQHCA